MHQIQSVADFPCVLQEVETRQRRHVDSYAQQAGKSYGHKAVEGPMPGVRPSYENRSR